MRSKFAKFLGTTALPLVMMFIAGTGKVLGQEQQKNTNNGVKIETVQKTANNGVKIETVQKTANGKYTVHKKVKQEGDCTITETVQKKTPQQLYKERWAKWKKDNNATDAEVRAAQEEENRKWAEFKASKPAKAKEAIQKQVDGTAKVIDSAKDCPEGVDCEVPVVGSAVPFVVQDTLPPVKEFDLVADCPICPDVKNDSIPEQIKEKQPWSVIVGVGQTKPTGHNPDAFYVMNGQKPARYMFAEVKSPSFAQKGIGSWFRGTADVRIYEKQSYKDVLVVKPGEYEDSYHLANISGASVNRDHVAVGIEVGKDINSQGSSRFNLRPNAYVKAAGYLSKPKFEFPEGDGEQVNLSKPLPLDLNIGAGLIATYNISGKKSVQNGNGLNLYATAGWENHGILGKQAAYRGEQLIQSGDETGPNMRDSHRGVFSSGNINLAVGLKYNFGGKKNPKVDQKVEEPAVNPLDAMEAQLEQEALLKAQQENQQEVVKPAELKDADGNIYHLEDENIKVVPRAQPQPAPAAP